MVSTRFVIDPVTLEGPRISSDHLDIIIHAYIEPFLANGEAFKYGAVLVTSWAASRPKPHHAAKRPLGEVEFSPLSTKPIKIDEGVYQLDVHKEQKSTSWVDEVEIDGQNQAELSADGMKILLESGSRFGTQCPHIETHHFGLRHILRVKTQFIITTMCQILKRVCQRSGAAALSYAWMHVETAGAPQAVRLAPARVTTMIFNHRGAPRHWIIVPAQQKDAFEQRIKTEFGFQSDDTLCSQFVSHIGLWLTTELLQKWEIQYYTCTQREQNLVFVFPDSYYWGWSSGFSVGETKLYGGPNWQYDSYKFCKYEDLWCNSVTNGTASFIPLLPREADEADKIKARKPMGGRLSGANWNTPDGKNAARWSTLPTVSQKRNRDGDQKENEAVVDTYDAGRAHKKKLASNGGFSVHHNMPIHSPYPPHPSTESYASSALSHLKCVDTPIQYDSKPYFASATAATPYAAQNQSPSTYPPFHLWVPPPPREQTRYTPNETRYYQSPYPFLPQAEPSAPSGPFRPQLQPHAQPSPTHPAPPSHPRPTFPWLIDPVLLQSSSPDRHNTASASASASRGSWELLPHRIGYEPPLWLRGFHAREAEAGAEALPRQLERPAWRPRVRERGGEGGGMGGIVRSAEGVMGRNLQVREGEGAGNVVADAADAADAVDAVGGVVSDGVGMDDLKK